jgi:alkylhydroperoxidase family enzyme
MAGWGETEQRLYLLDARRESSLYTERERAALTWTEALTRIAETHAPDATYDEVRRHCKIRERRDFVTLVSHAGDHFFGRRVRPSERRLVQY